MPNSVLTDSHTLNRKVIHEECPLSEIQADVLFSNSKAPNYLKCESLGQHTEDKNDNDTSSM